MHVFILNRLIFMFDYIKGCILDELRRLLTLLRYTLISNLLFWLMKLRGSLLLIMIYSHIERVLLKYYIYLKEILCDFELLFKVVMTLNYRMSFILNCKIRNQSHKIKTYSFINNTFLSSLQWLPFLLYYELPGLPLHLNLS